VRLCGDRGKNPEWGIGRVTRPGIGDGGAVVRLDQVPEDLVAEGEEDSVALGRFAQRDEVDGRTDGGDEFVHRGTEAL